MRKRFLSLIMSLTLLCVILAGLTVVASADEKAVKGYITEAGDYFVVEKDNLTTIILQIGNYEAKVNNEKKDTDAAPIISQDRTMVPIRYISEELGANVIWVPSTRTVSIAK